MRSGRNHASSGGAASRPERPNGMRLGRIAGVEVTLDWSLLIIFALIAMALSGGVLPRWHPDWGQAKVLVTAFAAAALFLVSVLVHELAHALVGRRLGVEIRRITLFVFGGMAHMEGEPKTWQAELGMAIAGPLASLALGLLCLMLGRGHRGADRLGSRRIPARVSPRSDRSPPCCFGSDRLTSFLVCSTWSRAFRSTVGGCSAPSSGALPGT